MPLRWSSKLGLFIVGMLTAHAAHSAEEDWPCIQRRVAELSIAQMWDGPPVDTTGEQWRDDPRIASLARTLASRRMSLDKASSAIEDFGNAAGPEKDEKLTLLFEGLFELINAERRRIINGIERYARKQKDLAREISETSRNLRQDTKPTPERTALEQKLLWATRIYDERNRALTYVCESPVLLEQRAYALAQEISRHLK